MNSRCTFFIALLILAIANLAVGGPVDVVHHSLIKLHPKSKAEQTELWSYDLDFLPEGPSPENMVAALPSDLQFLQQKGISYEVIHMDLEDFYVRRARGEGSLDLMGGYKTMDECYAYIHNLHVTYPTFTTDTFSIGNTLEGRHILCMKISDNPNVDEDEIELYYNSLIHAREPAAMEANLYFMNHLCANYAGNPDIANLVNNREFFFIPIVNPDGYEYNRSTNPGGGGLWRKNRRNNGDGSMGVDLNRNFGFNWGFDNSGSSPTPSSETYRGTSAFSEPETQVVRDFVNSRHFVVAMNYHTYSNLVLHPWGTASFQGGFTPDESTFQVMRDSMAYYIQQVNGAVYTVGPPWQILYSVNGDANDWAYGEQAAHRKIYAFTTEIGSSADGFWPTPDRITPLCAENLPSNLFIARYAVNLLPPNQLAKYVSNTQTENTGNSDGIIQGGESIALNVRLKNIGGLSLTGLSGILSTVDPYATITTANANWNTLLVDSSANSLSNFIVSVSNSVPANYRIPCSLRLTASSGLDTTFTIGLVVGAPGLSDNMENGINGWTANVLWHQSTRRANSPTHAWYSGNEATGVYNDNMDESLITPQFIVSANSTVSFSHWYNLEANFDYGLVEVNYGAGWISLGAAYTGASGNWLQASLSLASIPTGSLAQLRFRMTSDGGVTAEGWYVDDLQIGPPPNALVTPASLSVGVIPNNVVTREVYIQNTGSADLVYSVGFASGATLDTSGADSYGYRWQNSLNGGPCGPAFTWLNLASATPVNFTTGDQTLGPYLLNFSVPFYGGSYNRLWICSNGWVSFVDSTSTAFNNVSLPAASAPAGAICPWWDDLKPQLANSIVRFWTNNTDSMAVYYDSVRAGTSPNQGSYKFELLITKYGEIKFFYNNMGTIRLTSATVGIQSPDKSTGITMLSNQVGIQNSEAARFAMSPRWLTVLPQAGVIPPGDRDTLLVRVLGGLLCTDPSSTALNVRSNDPDASVIAVPISANTSVTPDTPAGLTIYSNGVDVILSWNSANNATGYRIERATSSDGPFTQIGTSVTTSYTDLNAVSGAPLLFYQVRATN